MTDCLYVQFLKDLEDAYERGEYSFLELQEEKRMLEDEYYDRQPGYICDKY